MSTVSHHNTHAPSAASSDAPPFVPQIRLYQNWLRDQRGLTFDNYDALWRWSITDMNAFWQSIWDYFDLQSHATHCGLGEKHHAGCRVVQWRTSELRTTSVSPC